MQNAYVQVVPRDGRTWSCCNHVNLCKCNLFFVKGCDSLNFYQDMSPSINVSITKWSVGCGILKFLTSGFVPQRSTILSVMLAVKMSTSLKAYHSTSNLVSADVPQETVELTSHLHTYTHTHTYILYMHVYIHMHVCIGIDFRMIVEW